MASDGLLWGLSPILAILLVAALPTHVWRWLGVAFSQRLLNEQSEVFVLVKAVATALVSALIAELVLFPSAPLATVPTTVRVGAVIVGFAAFLVFGRRLGAGIVAAELCLIAAWFSLT
ncbi:MAG: AzlD domain-containing protein [Pseudomonadota bacterium]